MYVSFQSTSGAATSSGSGSNINFNAMLQAYNSLQAAESQMLADLQKVPPDIQGAQAELQKMQAQEKILEQGMGGDSAIAGPLGVIEGVIGDLSSLLNGSNPDAEGCIALLTGSNSEFTAAISLVRQFIMDPSTQGTTNPNFQNLLQDLQTFMQYLAEFKKDLADGNYNAADAAYGYVLSYANKLYEDAGSDPALEGMMGSLGASVEDIRTLFLQGDYAGCLKILNSGTMQQSEAQILSALLSL